jgi:LEA14-like dessication related protein
MFMHSIERPSAKVRDVKVGMVGMGGVSGQIAMDVTNPNDFGVPLSGIDWELKINGARAATGNIHLSRTIPARGVTAVETSLTIDAADAIAVASSLGGGGRDYEVDAQLHFATPVGQLDVDVTHTGTL